MRISRSVPSRSSIAPILGLLLASLHSGCGGLGEREADLFEKGRAAAAAKDWQGAIDRLNGVLEAEPDFAPALFLRGQALFALGRHGESLADLSKAEASGLLEGDERFTVVLLRGRCLLEQGRRIMPETELRSGGGGLEERRRARDLFLKANLAFLDAAALRPGDYEADLWRGCALLRLENFRKALDVLSTCESSQPGRWEHRFFAALALEGLYKVNTESIESLLSIVEQGPLPETEPVYEYLTVLSPEVAADASLRIFRAVERFAGALPGRSPRIAAFLQAERQRREAERRQAGLQAVSERVEELVEKERFREALEAIDGFLKQEGESQDITRLLRDTQERWSLLLEARAEGLLGSADRDLLETALKSLETARTLTIKVDRLVVLQQKINALELALARMAASRKIQECREHLVAGRHQVVLEELASLSPEGLGERDRDLYHYLRGVSSYHLGQWASAAKAFASVARKDFEGMDVLQGLALVRSGQEAAGIPMLAGIPLESREDDVNRLLGRHFAERGEHAKAVAYLADIKSPLPADLESQIEARRQLGLESYRRGDFQRAAEELQAARQILAVHLRRKCTDVCLHLGNAYFRLEDYPRAKEAYAQICESELTATEREECRDLFLHRARIHLLDKSPEPAYKDLAELVRLGGRIPPDLSDTYSRLAATYADFLPLDRVQYWNYVSTARDYNYTLLVKGEAGDGFRVERKEGGTVSEEVWTRQGIYLTKKVGEALIKLPVNLQPGDEALPHLSYQSQDQECTAEVVALGQAVEVPGGRKFPDCLKVRLRRLQKLPDGKMRSTRHIFYFAPDVGEVKQEIYRDDTRVSEIVLSDWALKAPALGN
ncbi:MAG: tetratricopeptide repeat protein [Planctomycetes bacterium]|nr:tetratricopeptide repeat protein [Planctomycetota bacterium]